MIADTDEKESEPPDTAPAHSSRKLKITTARQILTQRRPLLKKKIWAVDLKRYEDEPRIFQGQDTGSFSFQGKESIAENESRWKIDCGTALILADNGGRSV